MPNWSKLKKMAAAFGRAVEDPSATKGGRDMVFESKTVQDAKDRTGDYTVRINEKDTPAQKSFKAGRYQGQEASDLTYDARKRGDADFQKQWDDEAGSYTDRDLEQDFDKAFTSNINRRKEKVRGGFGDESADMFEEQLWNIIDELKANGKSGNDILDMLRVDKPKAPYGE